VRQEPLTGAARQAHVWDCLCLFGNVREKVYGRPRPLLNLPVLFCALFILICWEFYACIGYYIIIIIIVDGVCIIMT